MAVEAIAGRSPAAPRIAAPVRLPLTEPAIVRWILTGVALAFLLFFLVLPFVVVFTEALRQGLGVAYPARTDAAADHRALRGGGPAGEGAASRHAPPGCPTKSVTP